MVWEITTGLLKSGPPCRVPKTKDEGEVKKQLGPARGREN